jgi:DNA ligase-1
LNVSEEDWRCLTYLVFDAPAISAPYEDRLNYLKSTIKIPTNWQTETYTTYAALVGVQRCQSREHLQRTLDDVLKLGGEGVMLRQPRSFYEHKRSDTLRKVERFYDEEALVIGHQMGKGRCLNMMGCLKCKLPNGIEFAIGSGFDDAIRRKPPRIDSVVTFKFQELTKAGKPRFPVFLRERSDMTWEGDLAKRKD